jgi:hypothetical protein
MDYLSQLLLDQRIRELADQFKEEKKLATVELSDMADEFGLKYFTAFQQFNENYRQLNEPDHIYRINIGKNIETK